MSVSILLPASNSSGCFDISWPKQYEEALKAKELGKTILWIFDLGIDPICCSLTDEAVFAQRALVLSAFSKDIYPHFSSITEGIVLANSSLFRLWHQSDFSDDELRSVEEPFRNHLKAMTLFADYLHRLASFLPEESKIFVRIDASNAEKSDKEILCSKERFRYIEVLENQSIRKSAACVIPEDKFCHAKTRHGLNEIFAWSEREKVPLFCIPESLLNEEWGEVETLVFFAPAMTPLGQRMAKGFAAAGGQILYFGKESCMTFDEPITR